MYEKGLETLLELDGEVIGVHETSGHWVKIEARRVDVSDGHPHGIRYSLTLHDAGNGRILGYDNAHGIPKRKTPFDHRHRTVGDIGIPYDFSSAEQLLQDFWSDVDRIVKQYDRS